MKKELYIGASVCFLLTLGNVLLGLPVNYFAGGYSAGIGTCLIFLAWRE